MYTNRVTKMLLLDIKESIIIRELLIETNGTLISNV